MTDNIRNIFRNNIKLLGDLDKSVIYFREQQYNKALGIVAAAMDQIRFVIEQIITDREYFNLVATQSLLEMLTGILEAKKSGDYILLADLLELQLLNFLVGVQELIIGKEEILFDEDYYKTNLSLLCEHGVNFTEQLRKPINTTELLESGYRVEFTSSGQMTLAAENNGTSFYFHTNHKIQTEAFQLARYWFQKDIKSYIIYGFGMGYHIRELLLLAEDASVEVYESDINVVQLACAFTDLKEFINDERIRLIYDPMLIHIKERLSGLQQGELAFVHYPSYQNIKLEDGKEALRDAITE